MNPTLTPSQFTSLDIRARGVAALLAADEQPETLEMHQVQEERAASLRHIKGLRPHHPTP